jgi:hypothetical protein
MNVEDNTHLDRTNISYISAWTCLFKKNRFLKAYSIGYPFYLLIVLSNILAHK